jgi:predicted RND superfamily exporter protein
MNVALDESYDKNEGPGRAAPVGRERVTLGHLMASGGSHELAALAGRFMRAAARHRVLVLSCLAAVTLAAIAISSRVSVNPDVTALLPRTGPAVRAFDRYLTSFGTFDRLYVLFEAPPDGQLEEGLVEAYERRLRGLPEIAGLDELFGPGHDWQYLADRQLLLLRPDELTTALRRFQPTAIASELRETRELLSMPTASARGLVQQDPLGLLGLLRSHFAAAGSTDANGLQSPDGRSRLIVARPTKPPFDRIFTEQLLGKLEALERSARDEAARDADDPEALKRIQIQVGGAYNISHEADQMIRREAIWNMVSSLAGILLLLVIVFRSLWLLWVGAIPMITAGFLALALNSLIDPRLSAAAAAAAALLFGLGIDGLVLLYVRYLEERARGLEMLDAITALGEPVVSMTTGFLTTAATFLAVTVVDFPSLRELGRLVGFGMVFGAVCTAAVVAALVPSKAAHWRAPTADRLASTIMRYGAVSLVVAGVATVVLGWSARSLQTDFTLRALQLSTPVAHFDENLRKRFGLSGDPTIILGESASIPDALALDERFRRALSGHAGLVGVTSVTDFLPTAARQDAAAEAIRAAAPPPGVAIEALTSAASTLGFRPHTFDAFAARLPAMLGGRERLSYEGYQAHGFGDLIGRFIVVRDGRVLTAAYASPRSDADAAIVLAAAREAGPDLVVTGLRVVDQEISGRVQHDLTLGLLLGVFAVFVLVWIVVRDVWLSALALVPALLGLIWSAGVLAAAKLTLDLFSTFGVLTFIGIAVDYGIHLVHRAASDPSQSVERALSHLAPANLVAFGIAVLGCGTLAGSSYQPLSTLGIFTVVSLTTGLFAAMAVLPVCLAWTLERRRRT